MERIAIISDIHGNMPAFRAALADIDRRGIGRILCLGDLAGKGPDGDQVVDICQVRCELVIRGNWDEGLADPGKRSYFAWHQDRLGPERLAYLGALPFAFDFTLSGKRIRLVHASPQGTFHRVHQSGPVERQEAMFESTAFTDPAFQPDIVGYGDIHVPFVRTFPNRMLVNAGSVGNPLDTTLACYVILEGSANARSPAPLAVSLVRVPYDIERAIRDAADVEMPDLDAYAWELRTARYRGSMPQETPA